MVVHQSTFSSEGLGGSAEGTSASSVTYKSKLTVKVQADPGDSQRVIYDYLQATSSLPWIGRSYRTPSFSDERVRCKTVNAELVPNGAGWWVVSAEYEQPPGIEGGDEAQPGEQRPGKDGKPTDKPDQWLREIDVGAYQISAPLEVAKFIAFEGGFAGGFNAGGEALRLRPGTVSAVMNSAGVPFDPPPEIAVSIRTFRVTAYWLDCKGAESDVWINSINSDRVTINWPNHGYSDVWEPRTAKVHSVSNRLAYINGHSYWQQTIEIHIKKDEWLLRILDRGTERAAGSGDPDGKGGYISLGDIKAGQPLTRSIRDADGYPTATPVLLDGKGQPLDPGKKPVWLVFEGAQEKPLSELINSIGGS